jgi:hypothetical protein
MGKMRNAYKVSAGKREGKRAVGRRRRRWKENINTLNRSQFLPSSPLHPAVPIQMIQMCPRLLLF